MANEAGDSSAADADLKALAERYLDLWQDQISALAADADFARVLPSVLQGMFGPAAWPGMTGQSPLAAWQAMMAQSTTAQSTTAQSTTAPQAERDADERGDKSGGGGGERSGATAGPAAAAAASERGGPGLDDILGRLAALEARIAAMEHGQRGTGARKRAGGPKKAARGKRS